MSEREKQELRDSMAQVLVAMRKANGHTQKSLARALDLTEKTISGWENAHGVPTLFDLYDLASLYKCDVRALIVKRSASSKSAST